MRRSEYGSRQAASVQMGKFHETILLSENSSRVSISVAEKFNDLLNTASLA